MVQRRRIQELLSWGILLLAFAVNLDNAIDSRPTDLDSFCAAAYIGCWTWFLLRGKTWSLGQLFWSGLTLVTAVLGLPVAVFRLNWDFMMLPALVFLTPFHGLTQWLPGQWWSVYLAAIAVSLFWLLWGLGQWKNGHKK